MSTVLRNALGACVVAASLAAPTAPAHAAGVVYFRGTAHVNCHGCGCSNGTASLTFWGLNGTSPAVGAPGSAAFTACSPPGPFCLLQGTASGSVTGAVNVSFNWTRVGGLTAVISTTGDIDGNGLARVIVTDPVGNPCGGPATFDVEGWIGGL